MADHPMQPLVLEDGRTSFKHNKIVAFLLKFARGKGVGLNELADMPWSQEDWDQFYQLIGYDFSGYLELSLVSDEAKDRAEAAEKAMTSGPLTVAHSPECLANNRRGCVPGCPHYDPPSGG